MKYITTFICLTFICLLIFISSGYSLFQQNLNITATTSITEDNDKNEDMSKLCNITLEFIKISQTNNTYTYKITIINNSNNNYKGWKLKIYDTGYIRFSGIKENDGWTLKDSGWTNNIIKPNSKVTTYLSFDVIDTPNNTTKDEYAEYFVKNFIVISGCGGGKTKEDVKITNKNASLNLGQNEEEVKSFTIEENKNYNTNNKNEKEYILTINNYQKYDYLLLTINIFFYNNTLKSIYPSEIIQKETTNITFTTPVWLSLYSKEKISISIIIQTDDNNFIPEVIIKGLKEF